MPLKSVDYQCARAKLSVLNLVAVPSASNKGPKPSGPSYLMHVANVTVVPSPANLVTAGSKGGATVSLSTQRREFETVLLAILLGVLGVAKLAQSFFAPFPDSNKTDEELELEPLEDAEVDNGLNEQGDASIARPQAGHGASTLYA